MDDETKIEEGEGPLKNKANQRLRIPFPDNRSTCFVEGSPFPATQEFHSGKVRNREPRELPSLHSFHHSCHRSCHRFDEEDGDEPVGVESSTVGERRTRDSFEEECDDVEDIEVEDA